MKRSVYVHEEYTHDLKSPEEIVPVLVNLFKPESVVDIGCGIGTFLSVFKKHGIKDVIGVDGSWANKALVEKYLAPGEFFEANLTNNFRLGRKFDIVLCLEVAEHLPEESAETLIDNIVALGDVVVFSAAVPNQGGQNHINEQPVEYWRQKFLLHKYHFLDIMRPALWTNNNIQWWYRQNMFVVVHEKRLKKDSILPPVALNSCFTYIHPELLKLKQDEIEKLKSGKAPLLTYLKLLVKKIVKPG